MPSSPLSYFSSFLKSIFIHSYFWIHIRYNCFQFKFLAMHYFSLVFHIFAFAVFFLSFFLLSKEEVEHKRRKKNAFPKKKLFSEGNEETFPFFFSFSILHNTKTCPSKSWSKSCLLHMLWQNGILISLLHTWANIYLTKGKAWRFEIVTLKIYIMEIWKLFRVVLTPTRYEAYKAWLFVASRFSSG